MGLGLSQYVPIAIYSVSALVILLSIFKSPKIGAYFLFPLLPYQVIFEGVKNYPLGNSLNDAIIISVIVGIFFKQRKESKTIGNKAEMGVLKFAVILFILSNLIGLVEALGISGMLDLNNMVVHDFKNYMMLPLIWFLTFKVVDDRKSLRLFTILLIMGFIGAAYYFWREVRYMDLSTYSEARRDRMTGLFVYLGANYYGAFFAHFSIMALGLFIFEKVRKFRLLFLFSVLFAVYCLLFTFSRGAYLGFICGLFFLGLVKDKKLLIIIAILLIFWQTFIPKGVIERISMTKDTSGNLEESAATRIQLWDLALDMFKSSPITGRGFNSFEGLGYKDTHNFYMKMLAELGILGLFSFIFLLFASFFTALKLFIKSNESLFKGLGLGFAGCVVAVAVTNAFGNRWSYISLGSYYWIFLGLVTKAWVMTQSDQQMSD